MAWAETGRAGGRRLYRVARAALLPLAVLTSAPVSASEPLIGCWDQSFAYTTIGIRQAPDGYHVRLMTQNEVIFLPFAPVANLGWGHASLDARYPADRCLVDSASKIFRCSMDGVEATMVHGLPGAEEQSTLTLAFRRLTIELMDVARIREPEGSPSSQNEGENKLLLVQASTEAAPVLLVEPFAHRADCRGGPDPFRER